MSYLMLWSGMAIGSGLYWLWFKSSGHDAMHAAYWSGVALLIHWFISR
jgi:hypothetical protein